jgi:hypothetical protein
MSFSSNRLMLKNGWMSGISQQMRRANFSNTSQMHSRKLAKSASLYAVRKRATNGRLTSETSYTYLVSYARSIPPTSAKAEAAALKVIATSLRLPSVFNFDSLLKVDSVMVVKGHQLFALLNILLQGGISEYRKWLETNEGILGEFGIVLIHVCSYCTPDAPFYRIGCITTRAQNPFTRSFRPLFRKHRPGCTIF